MTEFSRRDLLKSSVVAGGFAFWPGYSALAQSSNREEHFFLQILYPGGLDWTYLFDARPLAMTKEKLIQNYLAKDPHVWTGVNGQKTLATDLVKPLESLKDYFSVINGVLMEPSFDGHDQNMAYWLTGNPFGGESYVPHINQSRNTKPVDYVETGTNILFVPITNANAGIPLDKKAVVNLVKAIEKVSAIDPSNPLTKHLSRRMEKASQLPAGLFSHASQAMRRSFSEVPQITQSLKKISFQASREVKELESIEMISQLFQSGFAQCATIAFDAYGDQEFFLDNHDADSAKSLPERVSLIVKDLKMVLDYLRQTPYDEGRSMLDVTTIAVTSEFSRTMRQFSRDIDDTGTDHNPLTNTVLLAGKGIKGGHVVGASDFQSAKEQLSGAHLSLDSDKIKLMGRPFDFDGYRVRKDRPEVYVAEDYLSGNVIINTLYKLFEVPSKRYRQIGRNGPVARTIDQILS